MSSMSLIFPYLYNLGRSDPMLRRDSRPMRTVELKYYLVMTNFWKLYTISLMFVSANSGQSVVNALYKLYSCP